MSDNPEALIDRLRKAGARGTRHHYEIGDHWNLHDEAADELERLAALAQQAATPAAQPADEREARVDPWYGRPMPRADFLRAALGEIADSKSLTATPTQFYQHLQRIACRALTADAKAEQSEPAGEREAFEAWAVAHQFDTHRDESDKYRDYHRATTRWAWLAWQARAALEGR